MFAMKQRNLWIKVLTAFLLISRGAKEVQFYLFWLTNRKGEHNLTQFEQILKIISGFSSLFFLILCVWVIAWKQALAAKTLETLLLKTETIVHHSLEAGRLHRESLSMRQSIRSQYKTAT